MAHLNIPSGGLPYVRWAYNVPAKRGMRVRYRDGIYRITSALGANLRCVGVEDGERLIVHPKDDNLSFLTETCPECRGSGVIESAQDGTVECWLCDCAGKVSKDWRKYHPAYPQEA